MLNHTGEQEAALAYEETKSRSLADSQSNVAESYIDAQGVVHVNGVAIQPSDLWSREFREFYLSSLASAGALDFGWPVPERDAPEAAWAQFDAWFDERYNAALLGAALQRYPVEMIETSLGGVRVSVITPKTGLARDNEERVIIHLHGGGFFYNRGLAGAQLESVPVAAIGRFKVVTLDYRQAPLHRYPAASEDVEAVYLELLKRHRAAAIGICGCSAGAALASQAIARFEHRRLPRPGAAGFFSMAPPPPFGRVPPWGPGWGDSGMWFASVPRNHPSDAEKKLCGMMQWYMENIDIADATAYPGCFDDVLAKFPPTLFLSGTRDFASSTVVAAHARMLRLGVDASLYLMEGAPHAAHVFAVDTREAHDAHSYVVRWFDRHLE